MAQTKIVVPSMKSSTTMKSSNHASGTAGSAGPRPNGMTEPTLIEIPPMRFLILDAPKQAILHVYLREMAKYHVNALVRVCEPTYNATSELENAGIRLFEMGYPDGTSPPRELIDSWLQLVEETFYSPKSKVQPTATQIASSNHQKVGTEAEEAATAMAVAPPTSGSATPCIAVHCVAGLGRAPVMVAIALIEFAGMGPLEAVTLIRKLRRGAINEKQLLYLTEYKKQYKRRTGAGKNAVESSCCVIL